MLGYIWMLEREMFIDVVTQVFENNSMLNREHINKFTKYADEIELLDSKKYAYTDSLVLLDAKIIFKKVFLWYIYWLQTIHFEYCKYNFINSLRKYM